MRRDERGCGHKRMYGGGGGRGGGLNKMWGRGCCSLSVFLTVYGAKDHK